MLSTTLSRDLSQYGDPDKLAQMSRAERFRFFCGPEFCQIQNELKRSANEATPNRHLLLDACSIGSAASVSMLIRDKGFLPNALIDGRTALHVACYYGHHDVIDMLIRYGGSPWIRCEPEELTAFDVCRRKDNDDGATLQVLSALVDESNPPKNMPVLSREPTTELLLLLIEDSPPTLRQQQRKNF